MVRAAILQVEKDKAITLEDDKILEIITFQIFFNFGEFHVNNDMCSLTCHISLSNFPHIFSNMFLPNIVSFSILIH